MKNALVTGGAGFIGSHVVRELLKAPDIHVIVLDDLSGGYADNVPVGAELVVGSINDAELLTKLFQKWKFAYVYHLAAYAAEGLSHFIRTFNYTNNVVGSVNVINHCIKYKVDCLVFTSSIAVYGAGQTPMTEAMVPMPEDPYGIAKYAVELDLKSAHEMFGMNYVVFRPHNVYGEFQNIADRYRNVVGIFMNQILKGEPMTIFGDGEQERAFTYVADIAGTIASSAWTPSAYQNVFNVGAEVPYTVNALATAVAKVMGAGDHPIRHLAPRNEVKIAFSDHSAAARVFGKKPLTDLEAGLKAMADWVFKVGSRATPHFKSIEIEEKLPPAWR